MITRPLDSKWQQKWIKMNCVHPCIQSTADEVTSFCGRWFRNENRVKPLLVITGKPGTGKTHFARAIARFASAMARLAWEAGNWSAKEVPNYVFISWPVAANQFAEKLFGLHEDAMHSSLTILDDVGAESDPWKVSCDRLCQILSARENRFTVVTTNLMPEQWEEKLDQRISDRFLRNSVVKILTCDSYALTKHEQASQNQD